MFSIQISTFNRINILQKVLLSLNNQTINKDLYEVIVINDGSTDDTSELVQKISREVDYNLILINQEHKGLPYARNKGLINTNRKYILFIDDDVIADKNLIKEHLNMYEKYGDNIVVRGWVNHVDKPEIPNKPIFKLADISTSFFWTSNVSVKREFLIKAGLFCEKFYKYGWEDVEMGYKLRKFGLKLIINNKAIGYHYKPTKININKIEDILKIEEYKALSANVYYSMYKSLRVKLAIGYYFQFFYKLLYNIGIYDLLKKILLEDKFNNYIKIKLLNLIKKLHYYNFLKQ